MNIQKIITLIRSGSSNPDRHEGQRQIEEAVGLLEKLQSMDGLLFSQKCKLSKILGCKCFFDDIEKAVKELKEEWVANQWQSMDTAPKDGTEVLIASGKGTYRAWWRECADKGGGETGPAWQIYDAGDPYESWAMESPEYWRQLPFSPEYLKHIEAQAAPLNNPQQTKLESKP